MKKIFSLIGLATIISLSFIISEKTETVVKNVDTIMSELKENEKKYEKEPISATIKNDTIIPGINGKKINIEKTYKEMKKIGEFNEKYLIYDEIKPEKTTEDQYDKYIISGNQKKNQISLIFKVEEKDDITNIKQILDKTNTKATFFLEKKWFEKNTESALNLVKENHTIGILTTKTDNNYNNLISINETIKKLGKQKKNFCYAEEKDEKQIEICAIQKNHTIMPNIIIKKSPLLEIKRQITPGALISLPATNKVNNELELIIEYIKTKGYIIENIENHLSEKNNN